MAGLDEQVFAAAEGDMGSVAETMLRSVLGNSGWEGLPEPAKQVLVANGPAIVAEHRGGPLDVSAEQLRGIVQPTLLVAAKDSPPAFAEVTELMAAALPSAQVEWIEGGHLINPAHPAMLAFVDEVLALEEEPSTA